MREFEPPRAIAIKLVDGIGQVVGAAGLEESHRAIIEVAFDRAQARGDRRYAESGIVEQFHRQHQVRRTARAVRHQADVRLAQQARQLLDRDQVDE